ncbi:MAG: hypothetical protein ACXWCZ_05430 [Flavisolibacter sp.]
MSARLTCAYCDKTLAEYTGDGINTEQFIQLHKEGKIPVPNMGWLCSEECALNFEKQYDVRFDRTSSGKIDYYENQIK